MRKTIKKDGYYFIIFDNLSATQQVQHYVDEYVLIDNAVIEFFVKNKNYTKTIPFSRCEIIMRESTINKDKVVSKSD